MDSYDAIVYGNDLASLITALLILKEEKRVLLANQDNRVGNFTEHINKHRFTFDNIYTLSFDITDDNDLVNKVFYEMAVKPNFISDNKLFHIIAINKETGTKKEYLLPVGIDNFVDAVEGYIPGSKQSVRAFFSLAEECRDALNSLIEEDADEKRLKSEYPNFVKIVNKSVSEVLDYIDMPIPAQEIINACWIHFGATETELSFADYAAYMYNLVSYNIVVPEKGYEELSAKIFQEYLKQGGHYINGVQLNKIITLNHEVTGVLLNNEIYYTSNFITALNPSKVFNGLLEKNEVTKEALQLCNKRKNDGTPFTIYIGLNRNPKELELEDSRYYIYNNLDSDVEYNKMTSINNNNSIVTVNNLLNANISPKGTSIITIETYFFGGTFENYITSEKYNNNIDDIANNLISAFEEKAGIRIRDYIEEIKIVTPVDYYKHYQDANCFGHKLKPLDNALMRLANYPAEEFIKGLYFCSQYGIMGTTLNNMLLTSKFIAERIIKG